MSILILGLWQALGDLLLSLAAIVALICVPTLVAIFLSDKNGRDK